MKPVLVHFGYGSAIPEDYKLPDGANAKYRIKELRKVLTKDSWSREFPQV